MDFTKLFSSDPPEWKKNIIKIYEENGMNPFDKKSIEDKLRADPFKILELSKKIMGSIPFIMVLDELFHKYILPPRLGIQNKLHETLSEHHFH